MTIKILPPQLANQIAAGEVVERPASVVKELVENALDAGANKVEIEIERGGHKKILIKDNGKGIPKAELALALSRHATSKITDMDDLEAIVSLGFRGEALASISSVARLTMTSKPATQAEAWSAAAEGLDMNVEVKPAAHPNGTSVEVLDLFFNTPARRKFLRAEKTEFTHIESLMRRIAMSRPDASFLLSHNGKLIKRYRSQKQESVIEQQSARIAEVINGQFVEQASIRTGQYDNINVSIWAKSPSLCKSVNPAQYSFVNGRMMRDKLIQHAIRQAYANKLEQDQQPEYVLFINLPATDVDVNVHPAKHEVRFHHSRLLHDLIVGTVQECLASFESNTENKIEEQQPEWLNTDYHVAVNNTEIEKNELVSSPLKSPRPLNSTKVHTQSNVLPSTDILSATDSLYTASGSSNSNNMNSVVNSFPGLKPLTEEDTGVGSVNTETSGLNVLKIKDGIALVMLNNEIWLLDTGLLLQEDMQSELENKFQSENQKNDNGINFTTTNLTATPLLVPIRIALEKREIKVLEENTTVLNECGFVFAIHQQFLIIKQVPATIRSKDSSRYLPQLFSDLLQKERLNKTRIVALFCNNLINKKAQSTDTIEVAHQIKRLMKKTSFERDWSEIASKLDLSQMYSILNP